MSQYRVLLSSILGLVLCLACGSNNDSKVITAVDASLPGTGGAPANADGGTSTGGSDTTYPGVTNRLDLNFNLDWKYREGDASGAETPAFDDAAWNYVDLPHTTKFVTPEDPKAYAGISWYRKRFTVNDDYRGSKLYVEFEAAMQVADVWVNGTHKILHYGGYAPFTIDVTQEVTFGSADNVIAVKIDSHPGLTWPPGRGDVDFQYHGGLYRDARLHVMNPLHVTDAVFANRGAAFL